MTTKKIMKMYPVLEYFKYSHLPEHLQKISKVFADVALNQAWQPPYNNPEVATGLRKLLEAKDCFVRARL